YTVVAPVDGSPPGTTDGPTPSSHTSTWSDDSGRQRFSDARYGAHASRWAPTAVRAPWAPAACRCDGRAPAGSHRRGGRSRPRRAPRAELPIRARRGRSARRRLRADPGHGLLGGFLPPATLLALPAVVAAGKP